MSTGFEINRRDITELYAGVELSTIGDSNYQVVSDKKYNTIASSGFRYLKYSSSFHKFSLYNAEITNLNSYFSASGQVFARAVPKGAYPCQNSETSSNTIVYTTTGGSARVTLDPNIYKVLVVEVQGAGGGGGGGGALHVTNVRIGGGGGGGGYAIAYIDYAALRAAGYYLCITVGKGGAGKASDKNSANGDAGGDSFIWASESNNNNDWFGKSSSDFKLLSAHGGEGGKSVHQSYTGGNGGYVTVHNETYVKLVKSINGAAGGSGRDTSGLSAGSGDRTVNADSYKLSPSQTKSVLSYSWATQTFEGDTHTYNTADGYGGHSFSSFGNTHYYYTQYAGTALTHLYIINCKNPPGGRINIAGAKYSKGGGGTGGWHTSIYHDETSGSGSSGEDGIIAIHYDNS